MALDLATLLLGFTWACAAFTCFKAVKQTYMCWHRSGKPNAYIIMIWLEWTSCLAVSLVSWMFLEKSIDPSLGYFFGMLVMWIFQVQCITQIIINRVALLMFNPPKVRRLRLGVAVLIGIINLSAFFIWIPAHLHASPEFVRINLVWDRTEKCVFLLLELSLNTYFMWLIHSELIANGLTKYNALFKFNVAMVVLSICLDGVIIGVMSLPNDLIYLQFQALFFLIKLHIEMTIAELIAKIAKTTAASGNRATLHNRGRRLSSAIFSRPRSWHQWFGLDCSMHTIGQQLADNEGRNQADLEAGRLRQAALQDASGTTARRDSADTTRGNNNDWMYSLEEKWTNETCESCGTKCRGITATSQAQAWANALKSWTRRDSI